MRLKLSADFHSSIDGVDVKCPLDINDDIRASGEKRRAAKQRAVRTKLQELLATYRKAKRAKERVPKSGAAGDKSPDGEELSKHTLVHFDVQVSMINK